MLEITLGAVICADGDEGHVHRGCHMSPFKVVLVHIMWDLFGHAGAHVYSSETGMWTDIISAPEQCRSTYLDLYRPSTLVSDSFYCSSFDNMKILV
jgi:hypothetical protein